MARYDPERMEYSTRAILACAIAREAAEGRGSEKGGVYISVAHLPSNLLDRVGGFFFETVQRFKEDFGIDLKRDGVEIAPTAHYQIGGVKINERCETTLEGLYAAGECAGGVHGSNRLGADAMMDVLVLGCIAGKNAATRAENLETPSPEEGIVGKERDRVLGFMEAGEGPRPWELKRELQDLMQRHAGPHKTEAGLYKTLQWIGETKGSVLPEMRVRDDSERFNRDWKEALELVNMLDVAEMICRASLMRTETRPAHQRAEHPDRDDENWWKNIVIRLENGEMRLETRPVVTTRVTSLRELRALEKKEKETEVLQPRWW
jgi:fumarate reductase (CoM/CoB) subunit A